jgi:hypothetical protein
MNDIAARRSSSAPVRSSLSSFIGAPASAPSTRSLRQLVFVDGAARVECNDTALEGIQGHELFDRNRGLLAALADLQPAPTKASVRDVDCVVAFFCGFLTVIEPSTNIGRICPIACELQQGSDRAALAAKAPASVASFVVQRVDELFDQVLQRGKVVSDLLLSPAARICIKATGLKFR